MNIYKPEVDFMSNAKVPKEPEPNPYIGTFHINYDGQDPEKVRRGVQRKFLQVFIDMCDEGILDYPAMKGLKLRPFE